MVSFFRSAVIESDLSSRASPSFLRYESSCSCSIWIGLFFYECILVINCMRFFILPYLIIILIQYNYHSTLVSIWIILYISQGLLRGCLGLMITEEEYEYKNQFSDVSSKSFCFFCKKLLKHTVRILAKVQQQYKDKFISMCPCCMAAHCTDIDIKEYKVCNKMGQIVQELNNKSVEALINCISLVQSKGIQQMQIWREGEDDENNIKSLYLELNEKIFDQKGLSYKQQQPVYILPEYEPVTKDHDPPNRKHLKALGYNWSRNEFDYQPQSVFGLLLGSLEREEGQNEEEFSTLSNILFREYQKQQEKVQQTKDYLVNTMFLLGRKGFSKMDIPQPLLRLRQKQEQLKQLIPKINNLLNQFQQQRTQEEKERKEKREKKDKKEKKKKRDRSEQSKEEEREYQRSRENKKKKKLQKQAEMKQEKKNSKQNTLQHIQSPQSINQAQQQSVGTQSRKQAVPQINEPVVKRARGRPKGSIRKGKIIGGKFIEPNTQRNEQIEQEQKEITEHKPLKQKSKKNKKQSNNQEQGFQVKFDSD